MKKFDPSLAMQDVKQKNEYRGVNPSINDSATFTFHNAQTMTDTFQGKSDGYYLYSRHWNPSNKSLADMLAAMEDTEAAWVTGSGMAAITSTLLQLCNTGDHIVSSITTYGGTFAFLFNYLKKFNIETTFVDITDVYAVKNAMRENTKVIYTETMTNPLLRISNLPILAEIAHNNNAKLVCDNTFTPMIVTPAHHGVDIVVYSLTKFVNGKNDCVAGAICADADFINSLADVNDGTAMLLGPVLAPNVAASIQKNLHTLHIRMMQHSKNALYLANSFKKIEIPCTYPGMPEFKDHNLFKTIMNAEYGFGGLLTIDMKTVERANKLMEIMQEEGVGYLAVSLGYFKTLFSNSGKSTSSEVPDTYQKEMGMSEGLIRFSVGLDMDIDDTFQRIKKSIQKL